jgi:hypothetical protein
MAVRVFRAMALFIILCQFSAQAEVDVTKIGEKYKDKQPIAIYVGDFANESGKPQIKAEDFKKALGESLASRKAMTFNVVQSPAESILQVSGVIKSYQYMDRGPFKVSPSVGGMILEAAATASHNYVEMMVAFQVVDTKSGKVVWNRTLSDYVKKDMTPEQSIPRIYDVMTRDFVAKCFGKPK